MNRLLIAYYDMFLIGDGENEGVLGGMFCIASALVIFVMGIAISQSIWGGILGALVWASCLMFAYSYAKNLK